VASAQHELGLTFGTLVTADRMQIYKYVVQQVAGLWQDRHLHAEADHGGQRLGMHTHMSIWSEASRCSPATAMPVCRTVPVLHRRRHQARQGLNAFTNPTTNSYKRLVPG
jgi:glutamine synthetase